MSTASSSSRPMPGSSQRRPARDSDVFRPKLPLDPFALHPTLRESWTVSPESVWANSNLPLRQQVILVIGVPTTTDLEPITQSQYLANSLVILATHQPPEISLSALPSVRIIRLSQPLAIESAGAVRFVNLLERAERVARVWRKRSGSGIQELPENAEDATALSSPPSVFRFSSRSRSSPSSPQSSSDNLSQRPKSRTLGRIRGSGVPPADPTQRPFDGVFNFLPANLPDKLLLKQAILVTTISQPFLSASPLRAYPKTRSSSFSSHTSHSKASIFRASVCSTPAFGPSRASLASTFDAMPVQAHIVHLLPAAVTPRAGQAPSKLVQGIESFLLSFAYPARSDPSERAIPYVLPAYVLGAQVPMSSQEEPAMSVAELLVNGLLDPEHGSVSSVGHMTTSNDHTGYIAANQNTPRAWLSGARDIDASPSSFPSVPESTVSSRRERVTSNDSWATVTPPPTPPTAHHRDLTLPPSAYSRRDGKQRATWEDNGGAYFPRSDSLPTPPDSDESAGTSVDGGQSDIECGNDVAADLASPAKSPSRWRRFWART